MPKVDWTAIRPPARAVLIPKWTIAYFGVSPWILPARQRIDIKRYPDVNRRRERLKQRLALQGAHAKGRQAAPSERALLIEQS